VSVHIYMVPDSRTFARLSVRMLHSAAMSRERLTAHRPARLCRVVSMPLAQLLYYLKAICVRALGPPAAAPDTLASVGSVDGWQREFYCVCRQPAGDAEREGERMIQCDHCDDWFHLKCVNVPASKLKVQPGGRVCVCACGVLSGDVASRPSSSLHSLLLCVAQTVNDFVCPVPPTPPPPRGDRRHWRLCLGLRAEKQAGLCVPE
jgi:hypothetical protein